MTGHAFGDFVLDRTAQLVTHRETPIRLTPKAFAILALLVERAPAIVTRADFESLIWPEGCIEPANLTQTIYVIRKTLAAYEPEAIVETVNGRGYRLVLPTTVRRVIPADTRHSSDLRAPRETAKRGFLWRLATSLGLVAIAALLTMQAVSHQVLPHADTGAVASASVAR